MGLSPDVSVTSSSTAALVPTVKSTHALAMAIQRTRFRGFKLFYSHEQATRSMLRAIDQFPHFFTPRDPAGLIIDGGAHIGISVLEWKSRWPMSRVICFEPDPDAFELLQMNIDRNDIPGVQCVRAALHDADGQCPLYGQLGKGADGRGNSIEPGWGQRPGTSAVTVPCRRLSSYLSGPIAFLKLDIEGAEERVLREASSALHGVDAIHVEVHETAELRATNSEQRIAQLLVSAGFTIQSQSRFQPHTLPAPLERWRRQVGAEQTQLRGWR
jgi:FkbM family methyltransferase